MGKFFSCKSAGFGLMSDSYRYDESCNMYFRNALWRDHTSFYMEVVFGNEIKHNQITSCRTIYSEGSVSPIQIYDDGSPV
jgi:hypothetical protein